MRSESFKHTLHHYIAPSLTTHCCLSEKIFDATVNFHKKFFNFKFPWNTTNTLHYTQYIVSGYIQHFYVYTNWKVYCLRIEPCSHARNGIYVGFNTESNIKSLYISLYLCNLYTTHKTRYTVLGVLSGCCVYPLLPQDTLFIRAMWGTFFSTVADEWF